jgi:hypothetical protein
MKATRTLVVLCLLLSGCGSCRRTEEAPAVGEGAALPTTAAAPLQARSKVPTAAVASAPGSLPTRHVEGGVAPTPLATAGSGPSGSVPEAEENDGDCIVVADADPDYGPPPLRVTFSAEAECNVGQPTYKWNFGDGSPAGTEPNPSHTYTRAGDYTASVTITSPGGATALDEVDITVEEGEGEPQE